MFPLWAASTLLQLQGCSRARAGWGKRMLFQLPWPAGSGVTHPDFGSLVSWVSGSLTSSKAFSFSLHGSIKRCLYSDGKTLKLVYSFCRHDELMENKDFTLTGKIQWLKSIHIFNTVYTFDTLWILFPDYSPKWLVILILQQYNFPQSSGHCIECRCRKTRATETWGKAKDCSTKLLTTGRESKTQLHS